MYQAKNNQDEGIFKGVKRIGNKEIFGYKLIKEYFVDNSGLGSESEPALTVKQFLNEVKQGYFYAITGVGQFQVYIGEYEKISSQDKKKILQESGIASSKKISKNTRVTIYNNGDKTITLHGTDIIKRIGDKVVLSSGGWRTVTTKRRLNQWLNDLGIFIYQKEYAWYIEYNGNRINFEDNIELTI